jgi:Transposase DDE domain
VGWFYGFKLHLVVNDRGELLACRMTDVFSVNGGRIAPGKIILLPHWERACKVGHM